MNWDREGGHTGTNTGHRGRGTFWRQRTEEQWEEGTTAGQNSRQKVMERRRRDVQLWSGNLGGDIQYKGLTQ